MSVPSVRAPGKYVADSLTEQVHIIMPQHLNGFGKLFGGQLAAWIDTIAGVVALRHCNRHITTAAIDNLQFRESVGQNSLVVLKGRMIHTGTTSMEVRVDSYVEDVHTGAQRLINTAFVVEVALGGDGRPVPVPPLIPVTDGEIADFEAASGRKELRRRLSALFE